MTTSWEEVQADRDSVAEKFSWLFFYDTETITPNTWMGTRIQKNPLDLFVYAEIAYEVKPRFVIETGSFYGGSAIFWADIMRLVHGVDDYTQVISIDVGPPTLETERNIKFIQGSSVNIGIINEVRSLVNSGPVIVNLDSLHDFGHVHGEMEAYHDLVTPGSYMIVEDGVINGHPTHPEYGPGPYEACEQFLKNHPEFEADRRRERFMITANPLGYLKRIS